MIPIYFRRTPPATAAAQDGLRQSYSRCCRQYIFPMNSTHPDLTASRTSGILLHPLSLPGPELCGTLGDESFALIDWLAAAGQRVWQVLPLGPTGYGDSPYASFSAFAGNPYMVSLHRLVGAGDLASEDIAPLLAPAAAGRIDYGRLYTEKLALLRRAAARFFSDTGTADPRRTGFERFCQAEAAWLDDYALFMALKEQEGGRAWQDWPEGLRTRRAEAALSDLRNSAEYQATCYIQWQFNLQWHALRAHAESRGVSILGDAPIFVASDSADVWSNQKYFELDADGRSLAVAGVPPDYFSATGQLWGNPLYKWDAMRHDEYHWWKLRLMRLLALVHTVRIDHFRGFAQYWRVPADAQTAISGEWVDGPGGDFFASLQKHFGVPLPLVAEDLGLITPDVVALRTQFSLPGMKIFCFAPWGETEWTDDEGEVRPFEEHPYVPAGWEENCVAYPGTHDNDTFSGWFGSLTAAQQDHVERWLGLASGGPGNQAARTDAVRREMIRTMMGSNARSVIFQMQDILGLESEARLNLPGSCNGLNWTWRLDAIPAADDSVTRWLRKLVLEGKRG